MLVRFFDDNICLTQVWLKPYKPLVNSTRKKEEAKTNSENTHICSSLLMTTFLVHSGRVWGASYTSQHGPEHWSSTKAIWMADEISYPILSHSQVLILLSMFGSTTADRWGVTRARNTTYYSLGLQFAYLSPGCFLEHTQS